VKTIRTLFVKAVDGRNFVLENLPIMKVSELRVKIPQEKYNVIISSLPYLLLRSNRIVV
jgi:hypothetical protein